jgi:CpeT protein
MMRRTYIVMILLTAGAMLASCIVRKEAGQRGTELDRLVSWMGGTFSSQEQAALDSDFYDIRLQTVQIWPERIDGRWLYVEQASALSLERPYRQRVYRLYQPNDTTVISAVYEFDNPLTLAGAWRTPTTFDTLTPGALLFREGCAIVMHPRGDTAFVGSTVDRNCQSVYRGADYATSEVVIAESYLSSWDRGWDSAGVQVWGAEKGGYMFRKLREP